MKNSCYGLGVMSFGLLLYFMFGLTLFQTLCVCTFVGIILFCLFNDDDPGNGAVNENALLSYPEQQTHASPFLF